jgi:hypothetical protein
MVAGHLFTLYGDVSINGANPVKISTRVTVTLMSSTAALWPVFKHFVVVIYNHSDSGMYYNMLRL